MHLEMHLNALCVVFVRVCVCVCVCVCLNVWLFVFVCVGTAFVMNALTGAFMP